MTHGFDEDLEFLFEQYMIGKWMMRWFDEEIEFLFKQYIEETE